MVRAGALGDTILALPAVAALRHCYPTAHLAVAGAADAWSPGSALVDAIHPVDSPALAALWGRHPLPLAPPLAGIDLLIVWSARPVTRPLGIRRAIAASPYPPAGVHASLWLQRTLQAEGILPPGACNTPRDLLGLTPGEMAAGRAVLDQLGLPAPIVLHPGSGAAWKRWPATRFAAVANALHDAGHPVLLLAGPGDDAVVEEMQCHCSLPILRDIRPRRLATVLAHSRLFIGNDSGPAHLAAATGTQVLALFGPTDPASWAPLGAVRILRACAATGAVQGEIRVCPDPRCMEGITVEDVLHEVNALLAVTAR